MNTKKRSTTDEKKPFLEMVRDEAYSIIEKVIEKEPETLLSAERMESGWTVVVEALERRAVPDTQDLLARYELKFDEGLELTSWRQIMVRKRCDRLIREDGWIVSA